ncbi:polysaccharide pyruvyl transferase family protein [Halalkalibacter kiskunsagensis]|uniref:Polysaccharide pyruvyl transferase family protein n=1 Tax=Halalkalibacter kiskunsagensis TaxID=1548599 RepID=A0ABV6KCM2_9BACI
MDFNKAVLLNYTGNEDNWGCKATSDSLINLIEKKAKLKISYKVPIHYKKRSAYRYFSARIKDKIVSSGAIEKRILANLIKFYLEKISPNKSIYNKIKNTDNVILNGEGSIHNYCTVMIEWFFFLSVAKQIYNKKTSIINHTLQFDDENAKRLSEIVYSKIDNIITREHLSTINLNKIGINNVSVSGDAAFFAEPCSPERSKEILNSLGVQGPFICLAGTVVLEDIPFDKYIQLINGVKRKYKLPIVFTASCEIDRKFIVKIKHSIPDIIIFDKGFTYNELLGVIKASNFFITGRFHPMIFSMIAKTPFIAYQSNTIKMQGVLEMVDYPIEVVDFVKITEEELLEKIEYIINNEKVISNNFGMKVNEIRRLTSHIYQGINISNGTNNVS